MADIKKATGQIEVVERGDGYVKFKLGQMTLRAWAEGVNACETTAEDIEALDGKYATAEYVDVKKGNITYHNALSLKPAPEDVPKGGNGGRREMTPLEQRYATARAIAPACIAQGYKADDPNFWFNWIEEKAHSLEQSRGRTPEDEEQIKREKVKDVETRLELYTKEGKAKVINECAKKHNWIGYRERIAGAEGLMGLDNEELTELLGFIQELTQT